MATLQRINPWVTGETITAEGLNGAKTGTWILELSEEEYNRYESGSAFSINIDTELSWYDFENMYIEIKHNDSDYFEFIDPSYGNYIVKSDLIEMTTQGAAFLQSKVSYVPSTGRFYKESMVN